MTQEEAISRLKHLMDIHLERAIFGKNHTRATSSMFSRVLIEMAISKKEVPRHLGRRCPGTDRSPVVQSF